MTLSHVHNRPRMPDRVVVLGSSGFLGRGLARACAAAGIETIGLGSREVDLADASAGARLAERLRPRDVVVFLSALTPDKGRDSGTLMRNLAMCRAVCEATRAVDIAQLVYASSDAVYSFATTLISEATPPVPIDLYGVMHRARELMLASEAKAPVAVLRLTAIYGAGDTHNSYGPNRFMRQALKDGRIALFGNGEETRDHLHVDDAVDLHPQGDLARIDGPAQFRQRTFRDVSIGCRDGRRLARAGRSRSRPRRDKIPATHRHFDTTNLLRAFPGVRFKALDDGLAATFADMRAAASA